MERRNCLNCWGSGTVFLPPDGPAKGKDPANRTAIFSRRCPECGGTGLEAAVVPRVNLDPWPWHDLFALLLFLAGAMALAFFGLTVFLLWG